jgi:hypothetical protein
VLAINALHKVAGTGAQLFQFRITHAPSRPLGAFCTIVDTVAGR